MKYIAFYLPQFHTIPENDKWWGKGFTEWTNVKKAKPLFINQIQPNIPLNHNYYNLLDRKTVEWQTNLMNKFKIYGFCYFHYWFCGKKLLEKPAENLLKWKEINQNFCFAWANQTWARTWSACKKSTNWVSSDNNNNLKRKNENGILLLQEYGDKKIWINHYNYLKNFFKDKRYIKKDNKPLLLIYNLYDIPNRNEMFSLWDDLSKKDGFDGIYLISINAEPCNSDKYIYAVAKYGNYPKYDKHYLRYFTNKILNKLNLKIIPEIYNYKKVWNGMVCEKYSTNHLTYPGAVVKYDETPRKGFKSIFLSGASPDLFEKYLKLQTEKAKKFNLDYIFIDAWNEWGEGNYLEPDIVDEYAYLNAVRRVYNATI